MSATPTSWRPGDRAVCISAFPPHDITGRAAAEFGIILPQVGTTYLVDEVADFGRRYPYLKLSYLVGEFWFCSSRFRKVVPACDREAVGRADTTPSVNSNINPNRKENRHTP